MASDGTAGSSSTVLRWVRVFTHKHVRNELGPSGMCLMSRVQVEGRLPGLPGLLGWVGAAGMNAEARRLDQNGGTKNCVRFATSRDLCTTG